MEKNKIFKVYWLGEPLPPDKKYLVQIWMNARKQAEKLKSRKI